MSIDSIGFDAQRRGWRLLKGLRPAEIELARIELIRRRSPEELFRQENLEALLLELGLNDEGLTEFPACLHRYCGNGLHIWQYPTQFSRYLSKLIRLGVRSYLELGIRHGGSFVATVEILERYAPLGFAVGVDIIPCPAMNEYAKINPRARFECINTQSAEFEALVSRLAPIDLVFVDSHHEEPQCRRELELLANCADMIAFHDIANVHCPGIARVWSDVKADPAYECFEYAEQYEGMGPYMGIGLAVKRNRRVS